MWEIFTLNQHDSLENFFTWSYVKKTVLSITRQNVLDHL